MKNACLSSFPCLFLSCLFMVTEIWYTFPCFYRLFVAGDQGGQTVKACLSHGYCFTRLFLLCHK